MAKKRDAGAYGVYMVAYTRRDGLRVETKYISESYEAVLKALERFKAAEISVSEIARIGGKRGIGLDKGVG